MNIAIEVTKNGKPALWERGGCIKNTGRVTLVTGKYAEPCAPIYIKNNALVNGKHALYLIRPDYLVINILRLDNAITVEISKIVGVDLQNHIASVDKVADFGFKSGDVAISNQLTEVYPKIVEAITAGINKSYQVNCRIPYYYEQRRDGKCHL